MARILLYILVLIGLLGSILTGQFAWDWLSDINNPVRDEYLEGMAICGVYFGVFWLGTPVVAAALRRRLERLEVTASLLPLLIALGAWLAVAAR